MPSYASAAPVQGTVAYVADRESGLQLIDVSVPATPQIIGVAAMPSWAMDVAVVGNKALVADWFSGLQEVDFSTPAVPKLIGGVDTDGAALSVMVAGNTALVTDGVGGLQVIDISAPATPQVIGAVDTPGVANFVAVSGTTAYVADYGTGLRIIDITNPASPKLIGAVDTGSGYGLTMVGTKVLMADDTYGLRVIDVANPASPQLLGSLPLVDDAKSVAAAGTTVLVTCDQGGVQVVDITTPANPQLIGSLATPGSAEKVVVAGTLALVADGDNALVLIDISKPALPKIIGTLQTPGTAYDVAIKGDTALVAVNESGLVVVDITAPASPQIIGAVDTPGDAMGVSWLGDTAYVADGGSGFVMVDISQPTNPQPLATVATPGWANHLVVSGGMAMVAVDSAGLSVVPLPQEIKPVTVSLADTIDVTLPAPQMPGNYTLRVFNTAGLSSELVGAVNFSTFDFATLDPNLLALQTETGDTPPSTLDLDAATTLQLIYKTAAGTPINLSNLSGQVTVQWLSSNPEVLAINPNGVIVAKGGGHALISAKVPGGGKTIAMQVDAQSTSEPAKEYGNLIVVAGRNAVDEELGQTFQSLANMAYETFRKRGIEEDDDIYYINGLVLTSTMDKWENLPTEGVAGTFSDYLLKGFAKGKSIEQAYAYAVTGVQSTMLGKSTSQAPLSSGGEANLWLKPVVGPWASAASFALFANYTGVNGPLQVNAGQGLALSSTLNIVNKEWVTAYAILTPPAPALTVVNEFETPALVQIKVPLSYQAEVGTKDYFGSGDKVFAGVSAPLGWRWREFGS